MTCINVSVDYPSARLLPLVNVAIEFQTCERDLLWQRMEQRVMNYDSLQWFKKLFTQHPDKGLFNDNWQDNWQHSQCQRNLGELRQVRLCAEVSDTVRLTGDCLARIDAWAGN